MDTIEGIEAGHRAARVVADAIDAGGVALAQRARVARDRAALHHRVEPRVVAIGARGDGAREAWVAGLARAAAASAGRDGDQRQRAVDLVLMVDDYASLVSVALIALALLAPLLRRLVKRKPRPDDGPSRGSATPGER